MKLSDKELAYIKLVLIAEGSSQARKIANKIETAPNKKPLAKVKKKKTYKKPWERRT